MWQRRPAITTATSDTFDYRVTDGSATDGPDTSDPVTVENTAPVFGTDPATSVLDTDCRAHELDNLYVVDTSFFPSIGAVNPSLTAIANALRVGDHVAVLHVGEAAQRGAGGA